ncbi:MAG: tetratricopeptide repeat protein, partial [Candidatus Electryoneaceae bacterium]|nr:tetratricopeptide repeat protein [Candidatus Electryoneaceae bacterium]
KTVEPTYLDLHLNIGVAYLHQGDTIRAVQAFRTEIEHHPSNAKAHNNLGIIAQQNRRINDALEYYRTALELSPNFEDARRNIVQLYLSRGDQAFQAGELSQAEADYRATVGLSLNDPRPWHRLALLMATLGRIEEAKVYLNKSLEIDPNYRPARELMRVSPFRE